MLNFPFLTRRADNCLVADWAAYSARDHGQIKPCIMLRWHLAVCMIIGEAFPYHMQAIYACPSPLCWKIVELLAIWAVLKCTCVVLHSLFSTAPDIVISPKGMPRLTSGDHAALAAGLSSLFQMRRIGYIPRVRTVQGLKAQTSLHCMPQRLQGLVADHCHGNTTNHNQPKLTPRHSLSPGQQLHLSIALIPHHCGRHYPKQHQHSVRASIVQRREENVLEEQLQNEGRQQRRGIGQELTPVDRQLRATQTTQIEAP